MMKKAKARARLDSVESAEAAGAYGEPVAEVHHEPVAETYEETEPAVETYGEPAPVAEVYEEPEPPAEAYEEQEPPAEAYEEQEQEVYHESGQDRPEEQVVKFLVSSRHLALASRYFFAKLSGPWMEASIKHIDGCYHMDASDWDSDALLILMQVIHGKTRSVPRRIDLEMLAKLAVLVDYYDCHEVIEVYCPVWIESLRDTLPAEYGRDVILWLLISCVFKQDSIFQQMTQVAVSKSDDPIRTMELPIPLTVVGKYGRLAETERSRVYVGSASETPSILLGALTKEMDKHRLLDPKPASPYSGYSIADTEKTIRNFRSPQWSSEFNYYSTKHQCTLVSMIDCYLNGEFDKSIQGFELSEIL
ncbi:hypothetical protein CCUS01_02193 [Colletotrichum cuscutae]|uniref:BTB domain-containing protein n=1 Tax=Colletotrichum cuscutae TaxID=1209917 RepID=A0AAI9U311_9PEZI|nr:hypothetical protein CCUS01_02193 [Colletotrichum cuscutae]